MVSEPLPAGVDLGLPASGPGRLASWPIRVVALVLDWTACLLAASALVPGHSLAAGGSRGTAQWLPLVLLVVESTLLTATLGGSAGQLVLGVHVRSLDGRRTPAPGRALVRSVLLALVLPAVVFDGDRRGLHDRAARTVVVRSR